MIYNISNNITFIGSEEYYAHFFNSNEEIASLNANIKSKLNLIQSPVELKLFVANQCPHCPNMIRNIIPIAKESNHIHLKIIDGTIDTELAAQYNILSVPSLILDNGFRWTGSVNVEEVVDVIVNMVINKIPAALSTASLKTILEDGKADWIAQKIVEHGKFFEGFIGLLTHELWSVRLGAMVVIEQIAENHPDIAITIAPELLSRFNNADIPTKGDILYALGEIGDKTIKDEIVKIVELEKSTHPEILEASQAAIESIEARY